MGRVIDKFYTAFFLISLFFAVTLDVMHFPLWPKGFYLSSGERLEQWYLRTFGDPIYGRLSNGWVDGMFFLEQLQIPFWAAFAFLKGLPTCIHTLMVEGIGKELAAIIVGSELVITVIICWFDIWASDGSVLSTEQKITLILMYSPWLIIPAIMAGDNIGRVCKRVERNEKAKHT